MNPPGRLVDLLFGVAGLLAVLTIWQIVAASGAVSAAFLPTVPATAASLWTGVSRGALMADLGATATRMVEGWLIAGLIGVAAGLALGLRPALRAYLLPTLEFLRPLPAPAIVPLAISLLGLGPEMILVVIVFGSIWPPMLSTISGLTLVEPRLAEVARLLEFTQGRFLRRIVLPSVAPDIVAGMRVSLGLALILSVLGEMLAGQAGLGHAILLAARAFRASDLFAGIILLSVLGILANLVLQVLHRRIGGPTARP